MYDTCNQQTQYDKPAKNMLEVLSTTILNTGNLKALLSTLMTLQGGRFSLANTGHDRHNKRDARQTCKVRKASGSPRLSEGREHSVLHNLCPLLGKNEEKNIALITRK